MIPQTTSTTMPIYKTTAFQSCLLYTTKPVPTQLQAPFPSFMKNYSYPTYSPQMLITATTTDSVSMVQASPLSKSPSTTGTEPKSSTPPISTKAGTAHSMGSHARKVPTSIESAMQQFHIPKNPRP